jgi:hypothetical protein
MLWHLPFDIDCWQHAAMKTFTLLITILFPAAIATSSFAQAPAMSPEAASSVRSATQSTGATGQPDPQEMMKQMMEMSKLNENHNRCVFHAETSRAANENVRRFRRDRRRDRPDVIAFV